MLIELCVLRPVVSLNDVHVRSSSDGMEDSMTEQIAVVMQAVLFCHRDLDSTEVFVKCYDHNLLC